jgi:hypothetical protein
MAQTQAQNGNAMQPKPPQMPRQQTQAQGLMSPPTNQQPSSVGSLDYYQELINLIEKAPASAVRQVVRDKWEKSLAGSQYHIAFLVSLFSDSAKFPRALVLCVLVPTFITTHFASSQSFHHVLLILPSVECDHASGIS